MGFLVRRCAYFAYCIAIVLAIPLLPRPGGTGSLCVAQPEPQGEIQCPNCGAWNAFRTGAMPSRCSSCGRSFSSSGTSGGGYSGGADGERGPTAMDQAMEEIGQLEQKLGPVRQQKQAKRDEIEKLRRELADLRKQIAAAKQAAAESKARKVRQQQALAVLEATLDQWRRKFEQRLLDLQTSLAQIEALRRGRPISATDPSVGDFQTVPTPVYLDEQDIYKQIDPSAFLTADIYRQALKERNRQAALADDLRARLAQMNRWRTSQTNISAEFAALQRNETTGLMGEVLDLAAPVEGWLEGAKVSRVVLTRYKVAYAAVKTAVAAFETAKAGTQEERDAKLQSATANFLEATTAVLAAGVDPATGKQLEKAARAYDVMTKTALAATTEEREAKTRMFVDVVALLNPYATAAKAACNLTERALRYHQLTKTLDELADQKHTTELLRRRLKDKIDSLDVNRKESQRIIDLWETTHPKGEGST